MRHARPNRQTVTDPLIVNMGFDPQTRELLLRADVIRLSELMAMDEVAVCGILVQDNPGFGMSNQLASDAWTASCGCGISWTGRA